MPKQDILVFFSDQHTGRCAGFAGDKIARTPNLDRIAANGTVFDAAYTSCPLCVPARMSMLTGQLPSQTGIFNNDQSIPGDQATWLHSLGAAGYETVLCGRMHFNGFDQRHGFTKRIFGETTTLFPGDPAASNVYEPYHFTRADFGCLQIIGGGNSPTLEYDRQVTGAALEYLHHQVHDKPQCIVVGGYAPHFPYVAPTELYQYYLEKVAYPITLSQGCNYAHPVFNGRLMDTAPETVLKARAAYWGMVEFMDQNIGLVYDAWQAYLRRNGREGIFIYLSDHGDQLGERGLYGKKTFFETSAQIPLIFTGTGIQKGMRVQSPVSIMDLGPTLCGLTNAVPPPEQAGKNLVPLLETGKQQNGRPVWSEYIETGPDGANVPCRMVRKERWKYITYYDYDADDLLFDVVADPNELENLTAKYPEKAEEMRRLVYQDWDPVQIAMMDAVRTRHLQLQKEWLQNVVLSYDEFWEPTPEALAYPKDYYASPRIPPQLKKCMDAEKGSGV